MSSLLTYQYLASMKTFYQQVDNLRMSGDARLGSCVFLFFASGNQRNFRKYALSSCLYLLNFLLNLVYMKIRVNSLQIIKCEFSSYCLFLTSDTSGFKIACTHELKYKILILYNIYIGIVRVGKSVHIYMFSLLNIHLRPIKEIQ